MTNDIIITFERELKNILTNALRYKSHLSFPTPLHGYNKTTLRAANKWVSHVSGGNQNFEKFQAEKPRLAQFVLK